MKKDKKFAAVKVGTDRKRLVLAVTLTQPTGEFFPFLLGMSAIYGMSARDAVDTYVPEHLREPTWNQMIKDGCITPAGDITEGMVKRINDRAGLSKTVVPIRREDNTLNLRTLVEEFEKTVADVASKRSPKRIDISVPNSYFRALLRRYSVKGIRDGMKNFATVESSKKAPSLTIVSFMRFLDRTTPKAERKVMKGELASRVRAHTRKK